MQDWAGSVCGVSVSGRGGQNKQTQEKQTAASCISDQRGSSVSISSSSTWTEPPKRSAVRCDPKVSLLVTGVGWDSLPLGSGDLTQKCKKKGTEPGGGKVRKRRRRWGKSGCEEEEGRKQKNKNKKKKEKKIIEDISQARSRLVKTNYVNREVKGEQIVQM